MYKRFPYLWYCALDWKVDQIATDYYPVWHFTWSKNSSADTDIKNEEDEPPTSLKRPCEASSDLVSKKVKISQPLNAAMKVESKQDEVPASSITTLTQTPAIKVVSLLLFPAC
jgi:hypothetical protein